MPPAYEEILDHVLIDSETLQARIAELGKQISADYADDKDLVLIGILKGCVLFMTDLMRQLTVPHMVDFMEISSYGSGARQSTGSVRILMDLKINTYNRNVLIVEDIVDSGNTLNEVIRMLKARQPASLKICTLLDKIERREVPLQLDYTGFEIPNEFVFGYGLDIDEFYRNLPFIGVVKPGVVISE